MAKEVILLNCWASPFGMKVRLGLAEKGIEYEYKEEDLTNKSELLLKSNPIHKAIPVLIHKNKPICESTIILQYIDQVWNDRTPLFPSDPYHRAQALFWADYIGNKIYPFGRRTWMTQGTEQEAAKKELMENFKVLEKELGDKPYFNGDTYGFIDLSLIPFYVWFYTYETVGNIKMGDVCPNIIEWGQRCMLRDTVANTLPHPKDVYHFISLARNRRGLQ